MNNIDFSFFKSFFNDSPFLLSDFLRLIFWSLPFQFSYVIRTYNPYTIEAILFPVVISFLTLLSQILYSFVKNKNKCISGMASHFYKILCYLNLSISLIELFFSVLCLISTNLIFPLFSKNDQNLSPTIFIINFIILRGMPLMINSIVYLRAPHLLSYSILVPCLLFFPFYYNRLSTYKLHFNNEILFENISFNLKLCCILILSIISGLIVLILGYIKKLQIENKIKILNMSWLKR